MQPCVLQDLQVDVSDFLAAPRDARALIYVLHRHPRRRLSHKVDTSDFAAAPCAASALIYSYCLQHRVLSQNPRRQHSKLGQIHSLFAASRTASAAPRAA